MTPGRKLWVSTSALRINSFTCSQVFGILEVGRVRFLVSVDRVKDEAVAIDKEISNGQLPTAPIRLGRSILITGLPDRQDVNLHWGLPCIGKIRGPIVPQEEGYSHFKNPRWYGFLDTIDSINPKCSLGLRPGEGRHGSRRQLILKIEIAGVARADKCSIKSRQCVAEKI